MECPVILEFPDAIHWREKNISSDVNQKICITEKHGIDLCLVKTK